MNYVFGDNYGGVQGAEQAADNSDRNWTLSLIAAQQQAQKAAQDNMARNRQLALNEDIARQQQQQQAFQNARSQEQDALSRDRFDVESELGSRRLDLTESELSDKRNTAAQNISDYLKTADFAGKNFAENFRNSLDVAKQSTDNLTKAESEKNDLLNKVDALQNMGLIRRSKSKELSFEPTEKAKATVDAKTPNADKINDALTINSTLRTVLDNFNKTQLAHRDALKRIDELTGSAQKSGFQVDLNKGVLLHPDTQRPYSFMPQQTELPQGMTVRPRRDQIEADYAAALRAGANPAKAKARAQELLKLSLN